MYVHHIASLSGLAVFYLLGTSLFWKIDERVIPNPKMPCCGMHTPRLGR